MTYWKGLNLVEGSKTKHYETDHKTVTRANAAGFFETFLGNAKHIPHWLISYRDHAHPTEREMRGIITSLDRDSSMRSRDHHYAITSRHGRPPGAEARHKRTASMSAGIDECPASGRGGRLTTTTWHPESRAAAILVRTPPASPLSLVTKTPI